MRISGSPAGWSLWVALSWLAAVLAWSSCSSRHLREQGGADELPGSRISFVELHDNEGYNFAQDRMSSVVNAALSYSGNKIQAPQGIAAMGPMTKHLSRITEIPFLEQDYVNGSLVPEVGSVYAIRYGDPRAGSIALIRIERISRASIVFSCCKAVHE